MTRPKPDKTTATETLDLNATVELTDAALDQAAAGGPTGTGDLVGIDFRPAASGFYGTGVYKTTDSGRGG